MKLLYFNSLTSYLFAELGICHLDAQRIRYCAFCTLCRAIIGEYNRYEFENVLVPQMSSSTTDF